MSDKEKTGAASLAAPNSEEIIKELTAKVAELEAANGNLSIESGKVAFLEAQNADLKSELSDAEEIITDLKDQLKDKVNKVPTVKVGKEKYLVLGGFVSKGKKFTAKDIAANPKIAEELVSKGSGLLKPSK